MREIRTYGLMRGCWPVRLHGGLGSTPPRPRNWAANPLLGEPLDGAGNLGSGCVGDMRQLRELPRMSALRLGFPTDADTRRSQRFAAAAGLRPVIVTQT
jgi:hypothetical protein